MLVQDMVYSDLISNSFELVIVDDGLLGVLFFDYKSFRHVL